jgi:GDP-4-dehydro-6-deoxy-D-mannose reductase
VDVVYHLAAVGVKPGGEAERRLLATNVGGTLTALELARAAGARRLVYAGSCFEYGGGERLREWAALQPLSVYGATKVAGGVVAQAYSRRHGLEVVWLRPFTVYGPHEAVHRLVPSTALAALAGRTVCLSSGEQRRDFIYVDDAVHAFVAALDAPAAAGQVLNVCSGAAIAVRDVGALIARLAGGAELAAGSLPLRPDDTLVLSGDPRAAAATLGWQATTPLEEGVSRTIEWLRAQAVESSANSAGGVR